MPEMLVVTVQTVGAEVGREDSVWGRECSGNLPWWGIAWQRCNWEPAFFWREIKLTVVSFLRAFYVQSKPV